MSIIPGNIVNNLAKIVKGHLRFHKVIGLSCSMLQNVKCVELELSDMALPNFSPLQQATIQNIMVNQNLVRIGSLRTETQQVISVHGLVVLHRITRNVGGFLDRISCDRLLIQIMKLDAGTTSCLAKMLQCRVRELMFRENRDLQLSSLVCYNGKGRCERISFIPSDERIMEYQIFRRDTCVEGNQIKPIQNFIFDSQPVPRQPPPPPPQTCNFQADSQDMIVKKHLQSWAESVGWSETTKFL